MQYSTGTIDTDTWSTCLDHGRADALCNAHILCDMDGVHHAAPARQQWERAAIGALTTGNDAAHTAREAGRDALASDEITSLEAQLDQAVRARTLQQPRPATESEEDLRPAARRPPGPPPRGHPHGQTRKHGLDPKTVRRELFAGNVWLPPTHA